VKRDSAAVEGDLNTQSFSVESNFFLRTKCGDGTWGLPSGAIEPSTARVISAERLKVICYKCVKGGRNRPALIRDLNGNACTELLKNCLQNTDPSEINGLKIRWIERSVRVRVPPSAYSMWGSNAAIWRRIRSQGSPRLSRTMSLRKSSRLMNARSCYLSHLPS
jgi:hypothetical protein